MLLTFFSKYYHPFFSSFLMLVLSSNMINAQQDTIYYNAKWRPSVKDSASFFRPPIQKMGALYSVKDYFITGELQMEGFSKSDKKEIWQGITKWYNKDGSLFQQGNYVNDKLEGDFITFLNNEKLVAQYKNGRFSGGKQNTTYSNGTNYYKDYRKDTILEITYENALDGIRFENYSTNEKYDVLVKYYGEKGVLLGERSKRTDGNFEGIEVFYYYQPMRINVINHFKRGRQFASSSYFPNGKPRELFSETPEFSKTFYDKSGEVIAQMTYKADQYGLKPYKGTLINYSYNRNDKAYIISSKMSYVLGKKTEEIIYHENQQIKTKTIFKPAGEKQQQIGFDEAGNEIARMEYKNYVPFNGTEILRDKKAVYKEGKLIEETTYYVNTTQVFSLKTTSEEKYYDKEGTLLGTLELSNDENYPKPLKGSRYYQDYYGGISSVETYDDGSLVEKTSYRGRKIGEGDKNKTFKKIEIYGQGTYNKIKEANYYSNGQLQEEKTFKNYIEQQGIYYNMQGELLGKYDFIEKEGVYYKFFGDSDEIQEIKEVKDGERIRYKKYTYGPNRQYGAIDPILVEDIDVDCCASFFDRDGVLIAKMEFKDKKPWNGTWYDSKNFEKFIFKKGERNGTYQKLDYNLNPLVEGTYINDQRNGVFTSYSRDGQVKSIENFMDDKLNGESTYYDKEGELVGKMLYKEGVPMTGTRTVEGYYKSPLTIENYADGKLIKKTAFEERGKRVTTFENGNSSETTVFHPDSDVKRLTFSSKNKALDGEVLNYDGLGNVENKAEVKDGRLVSGTIFLYPTGGDNNMKYCEINKAADTVELIIYGEDDKVLFTAKEHLYFGNATFYLQNLNIRMDYLTGDKLY